MNLRKLRFTLGIALSTLAISALLLVSSAPSISLFELGKKYIKNKNYEKAIFYLRQAMYEEPDNLLIYYKLGEAYTAEGNYNLAIDIYQKVLDKYVITAGNENNIALIHQTLAILSKKGKKYNDAIKYYKLRIRDAENWLAKYKERLQTNPTNELKTMEKNNMKWQERAKNEVKQLEIERAAHLEAIITFAENDLKLKRFDKKIWIEARPMIKVNEGDSIKGTKKSDGFIRVDNTSYMYVAPKTEIVFDKLRSSDFKKYSVMELKSGMLIVNTEQNLLNNYTIQVDNVSFSSEASKFLVIKDHSTIRIALLSGDGTIEIGNKSEKLLRLNEAVIKNGNMEISNISSASLKKFAALNNAVVTDQQIIVTLMKQLEDNLYNANKRENIVNDLIRIGPAATPYLVSRLKKEISPGHISETYALVESITDILAHIGGDKSKKALSELKKYPDKYVVELADYGLSLIKANE